MKFRGSLVLLGCLTVGLSTQACGPKDPFANRPEPSLYPSLEEKSLAVPKTEPGQPRSIFGHVRIENASAAEQEYARAIALIQSAAGYTGTGFFISPDGLVVTNNHVVSRDICSKERCAGIRVVRHMTEGGDMQNFNRLHVVSHSASPDLAILQVELPAGVQVPYLKVADTEDLKKLKVSELDLRVIGHPFGGPLATHPMRFAGSQAKEFLTWGFSVNGNSGSPLIDLKTGQVVGVHYGSGPLGNENLDVNSGVTKQGFAVRSDQITEQLKAAARTDVVSPFAPADRKTFLSSTRITLPQWVSQFINTPYESDKLGQLHGFLEGPTAPMDRETLYSILASAGLSRGDTPAKVQETQKAFTSKIDKKTLGSRPGLVQYMGFSGSFSDPGFVEKILKSKDPLPYKATQMTVLLRLTQMPNGQNLFDILAEEAEAALAKGKLADDLRNSLILQTALQQLTPDRALRLARISRAVAAQTANWVLYEQISLQSLIAERHPEWLGYGGMADTFPSMEETFDAALLPPPASGS